MGRGGRSLRRPQQGCELLALLQKCFKDLSQKLWLSLGLADISFRERLAQFYGYTIIAPINQRLQFLSLKTPLMLKEDKSRTKLEVTNLVENPLELKAHVHSKDSACCIKFGTDGKYENHPIIMLQLFQNKHKCEMSFG